MKATVQEVTSILERIYRLLSSLRGGTMIPTGVVLSPESHAKIVSELSEIFEAENISRIQLEHHLALAVSIRSENTDVVIVKELVPNPCPVCHHRLTFLRELIERFENDDANLIRCPMGHRYPGRLNMYYLNIFQQDEGNEMEKSVTACPECGSKNIQYLGPAEMFCLDCDWDSGMAPRYRRI